MKKRLEKQIIIAVIVILIYTVLWAEQPLESITAGEQRLTLADSTEVVIIDSNFIDTLNVAKRDSVFYVADSLFYSAKQNKINLAGDAKLIYHTSILKADIIKIDMKNDQAFTVGQSVMEDGSYLLLGEGISYDMNSEWGLVENGATKFEQGYCYGDEIRKIEDEAFDIDNAIFTTCDALNPHFYIRASKLRLYKDDKIIAKPLIVYVNHLPIFALPFGTFTIKRGRESGFLVPSPSYNSVDGKVLRDISYYQVFGKYADATLSMDYYENSGWELGLRSRYIKRYMLNGNFSAILQKKLSYLSTNYEWNISSKHHQDFSDDAKFDANLHFVSSTRVFENIEDIDERLQEEITSSLSYKRPLWGRTLTITGSYVDNLVDEKKYITLPSISYSLASKPIYELFYKENDKIPEYAWWKDFSYSYSVKAIHQGVITEPDASLSDIFYETLQDTTGEYLNQHNAGLEHSVGVRYSHKYKGWLNLSQSANLSEAWFDRDKNFDVTNNTLVRGSDYSTNSVIGFSLYGLGDLPGNYVQAIRHTASPNFSFSYKPDFSENEKFYSFGGVGLSSTAKQRKITFGLGNNWDLKLSKKQESASDELEEDEQTEKLNNFFKVNSSINYDFEKEDRGYSDIRHNISMNLKSYDFGFVSFGSTPSGSITQDTYLMKFDDMELKNWDYGVSNWTATLSSKLSFSGKAGYVDYFPLPENRFESNKFFGSDSLDAESEGLAETLETFDDMHRKNKNWSLNFNYYYQTNKKSYEENEYSSNLRCGLSAKITDNWEISYDNYVNLKTKEIASHNITLTRDLHCWKIVFTYHYTTVNDYWSYRLRLFNIKLPKELKFKTSGHKK